MLRHNLNNSANYFDRQMKTTKKGIPAHAMHRHNILLFIIIHSIRNDSPHSRLWTNERNNNSVCDIIKFSCKL